MVSGNTVGHQIEPRPSQTWFRVYRGHKGDKGHEERINVCSDLAAKEPELDCWVKTGFPEEMTLEVRQAVPEGLLGSVYVRRGVYLLDSGRVTARNLEHGRKRRKAGSMGAQTAGRAGENTGKEEVGSDYSQPWSHDKDSIL